MVISRVLTILGVHGKIFVNCKFESVKPIFVL